MSNDSVDGGPAFPTVDSEERVGIFTGDKGMSLRDYFAAQFAASIHSKNAEFSVAAGHQVLTMEKVCAGAYRWADQMLQARKGHVREIQGPIPGVINATVQELLVKLDQWATDPHNTVCEGLKRCRHERAKEASVQIQNALAEIEWDRTAARDSSE